MKKLIFLLIITFLGSFLAAQTTFCDAQAVAANEPFYLQAVEKIQEEKALLLQQYQNSDSPYAQQFRIFYGGKLGEATINNISRFLKNPFSLGIQEPLDFELFQLLIDGKVANDPEIIYPFLDEANKSILLPTGFQDNVIQLSPLYAFDKEKQQFYENDTALTFWESNHTYEDGYEFTPTAEEEIVAIFNPASGEFHPLLNDFFTIAPFAKWSPINQQIYFSNEIEAPLNIYDYEDNSVYATETDILVVFQNKNTEENRIASVGSLVGATATAESSIGGSRVVTTPMQKTVLTNPILSNSLPSIVTDALAQFLVRRTKEELTLAFFDQFRKQIAASNEFQTLLPNTNFLLQTQEDIFRIPSMGAVWVESFQSDIQNLVPNLERLLLIDPNYQSLLKQPNVQAFRLAYNLVDLTRRGEAPLNILAILQDRIENDYQIGGLTETLQILQLLGQELENCQVGSQDYLLAANELRSISKKQKAYFVALLFRKNQASLLPLLGNRISGNPLTVLKENQTEFFNMLVQLSELLQGLEKAGNQYNLAFAENDIGFQSASFEKITKQAVHLLEFSFRLRYFSNPNAYFRSDFYNNYYPIILNTVNAIGHVERQEYGIFLINLAQILQPIINNKIATLPKEESERLANFVQDFLFYGGFMVDILSALDAETVSSIIQQYALPIGSFRMKRHASFSMDVNAFPGLYMGIESGLNNNLKSDGIVGVTAPIGLTTSWGNFDEKDGQSFSLFFPIIDIGAAFSYRWGNQFGGFPDKLTWRQILSPGVHAVYGFRDLPISLMVGAQFMPQLRGISEDGFDTETGRSVWHFGVSGVVDIPLFNLHVRE